MLLGTGKNHYGRFPLDTGADVKELVVNKYRVLFKMLAIDDYFQNSLLFEKFLYGLHEIDEIPNPSWMCCQVFWLSISR